MAPARKGDVKIDSGAAIPLIAANPGRIQQALGYVVDNAVRYSKPGAPVLIALAAATREGRPGVGIAVRDDGRTVAFTDPWNNLLHASVA